MTTERTIDSCYGLSIILPVYNGESYINEAIDSCLNQNLEYFELIIVDDGSTDSTYDHIKEKANKDNHLVIIHKNANEGLSAARNTGIDYARYEYLTFLDADDKIKSGTYQSMLKMISATKSDLVVCDVEVHHVSGKTEEEHSGC